MNQIEIVMQEGVEEFDSKIRSCTHVGGFHTCVLDEEDKEAYKELATNYFKAQQTNLLKAVLSEVSKVDTHTGDDLADKCTEKVKTDIEALINNSTGV